jgi:predicted TIM-barrel fold metal-dependent hydrolase
MFRAIDPREVPMSYAQGRTFYDADSHIMELPDFLIAHADPGMRDRLPRIHVDSPRLHSGLVDVMQRRAQTPERVQELVALGDQLIAGPKGYQALGAFNPTERSRALDLLGFSRQLVFSTFSAGITFSEQRACAERYAAARAHNRAMAEFCAGDARLFGVALLPLDEPQASLDELAHIQRLGLRAVWVPHRPCGGRSPGHKDLEPIWAQLAAAQIPFLLHVGGRPLQIDPRWMNTGRPIPTDWLGGGENVRGKDMIALHHDAETFLGTLVLDGVLQRHPALRGGVIELGAGWVPSLLRRLDWVADIWRKSEPDLRALESKPSEQIRGRIWFTPYPYEDVGDLIRQSDSQLYLFSSDYPHVEGGRHPLGRFQASMEGCAESAQAQFYSENFAGLFSERV